MAFTENWGTSGTAGVHEWIFSSAFASIGTEEGTACLVANQGSLWTTDKYKYDDTGSWTYCANYTAAITEHRKWYIKLAETSDGGTELWVDVYRGGNTYVRVQINYYEVVGTTWYNKVQGNAPSSIGGNGWRTIDISYSGGTYTTTFNGTSGTYAKSYVSSIQPATMQMEIQPKWVSGINFIDYINFPFSPPVTILDFVGTYNDGTSSGTVNFGDDVIEMGGVSEYANTPLQTRGFSSSVSVTLDDAGSAWTDFVGDMTEPSWLNGTWLVRQEWGGTWTTLLTGQVNAEDIKYNAGEKTVSFNVHSTLKRMAENVLSYDAHYSDGTAAGAQVIDSMTLLLELGTITGTGTDNRTISFQRDTTSYTHPDGGGFVVNFHDKEYLWAGTEATGDSISIGSAWHKTSDENSNGSLFSEGGSVYSGTFTVSRVPDWMTTGAVMYYTRRWPNETQITGAGVYDVYGSNSAGYVKGVLYHMGLGTGAGWTAFEKNLDLFYTVQPQKYYYGDEKFVDILHHIAQSALFSYSTDASGDFHGFVMAPTAGTASEAIDFNDAFNDSWTVQYTQPVNKVVIKSGWIESENKFGASHAETGADYPSSRTETIEAFWLDSKIYSEGYATKIQRMYRDPLDQIVLELEGSEWKNISSGAMVAISNIPDSFPIYGTSSGAIKDPDYFIVSGKTYLYADDMVQINLTREIGGDWFRFNDSTFNGPDILW